MSFGLLHGAFRPADQVCVLRSLTRQRTMLLRSQGRFVQHMQKALTQMNLQLANVISDVAGETGQKILRAIVAGERDGMALAKLKNGRIRASEDEIARSLQLGVVAGDADLAGHIERDFFQAVLVGDLVHKRHQENSGPA